MSALTLEMLAAQYYAAKEIETRATEKRRDLGVAIAAMLRHESESSKTYAADGWKITVKAPVTRSMNWKAWETVKEAIHPDLWPVETKTVLSETGVKWLMNNEPEIYRILAEALTVKPASISVTVTPEKED